MILSARPIVPPVVITIFLHEFEKLGYGRTDDECENSGHDYGLARVDQKIVNSPSLVFEFCLRLDRR